MPGQDVREPRQGAGAQPPAGAAAGDAAEAGKRPRIKNEVGVVRRTVRGLVHIVGGLTAGLAIIAMLATWQLSKGPISLAFLTPYIEDAINAEQKQFKLRLDDTILTWAGWERNLDIRVLNVRVMGPTGAIMGRVPEVAFSLSADALFAGRLAPRRIELFGPKLRFHRAPDGAFDVGIGDSDSAGSAPVAGLIHRMLDAPAQGDPLQFLANVNILGADLTVVDEVVGRSWQAPASDVRLTRHSVGISGEISLVLDVDGTQTEIDVSGEYRHESRRVDMGVAFGDLTPEVFSNLFFELRPLRALALPLKGEVRLTMPIDGAVEKVDFNLTGGSGQLHLPAPIAQSVGVRSVSFRGRYAEKGGVTDIKELSVTFEPNTRIVVPEPVSHAMPLKWARLNGLYTADKGTFELKGLDADLGGPTVQAEALVTGLNDAKTPVSVDLKGTLLAVPFNEVRQYWPSALGSDAYQWVTTHLFDGMMRKARAHVKLKIAGDGALEIAQLSGDMDVANITVDYLSPMPKVRGASGHITFDKQAFNIAVTEGVTKGIKVKEGTIILSGLDKIDQFADIDLVLEGALGPKLALIDHDPLNLASAISIDPSQASGRATTLLKLKFLMAKDLTLDDIEVSARSDLRNVTLGKVFLGRGIRNGHLLLTVDKAGMVVTGNVDMEKIPAKLVWRENFGENNEYRSRYDIAARLEDVRHIRDLGLDMAPFDGDYIAGSVSADLRYTIFDDVDSRLEVRADLTRASMEMPAFRWAKVTGKPGSVEFELNLERDLVSDIPKFAVSAGDLDIRGAARYALDGTGLQRIDFSKLTYGRTDLRGALIPRHDGGWDAGFHGKSFDLSPFWEDILAGGTEATGKRNFLLPQLALAVEIDRVWLDDKESLSEVSGTFAYKDKSWQTALVKSVLDSGAAFELAIKPDAEGNRQLHMTSDDAGDTFRLLGYYKNMKGGSLEIKGAYDDAAPGEPLSGIIKVQDYRIIDAPLLTHVLSIMSLTGIADALRGDGLGFSSLEVPFRLHEGTFQLKEARASGASLGFTASGKVYTHVDVVEMKGTVIPAYALNSALGNIPILGQLLTGGEKGGGVFAANFSMTGPAEEPKVTVNPLSALTPGVLRNVFGIFDEPVPEDDDVPKPKWLNEPIESPAAQ